MILKDQLASLSGDPTLIIAPERSIRRSELMAGVTYADNDFSGLRIGVHIANAGDALPLLLALDNHADSIAIFSATADSASILPLAHNCRLDAIITDSLASLSSTPGMPPVFGSLADLKKNVAPRTRTQETGWVLMTSGTTGQPKAVSHTLASLTRTTKLTPSTRHAEIKWGMLYDYARFAGMQVFLQSILSGATLIAPPLAASLEDKIELFAAHGCTHLSGTPSLWRKLLMCPSATKLTPYQITLGGEVADDRILSAITATYPDARVSHVFASTEAGAAFSVTDRRAGFPLSYLSHPPAGIELKIEQQRLYVRNPLVNATYIGSTDRLSTNDGWVDTGDEIEIADDRALFKGRASGVINIGGDKVFPEEVEQVILSHPLVAAVRVYAKSNPITGQLVAADLVLCDAEQDAAAARQTIASYCRDTLGRTKAPAFIRIVPELQTNAAGKIIRSH